jgi:hypothetical protein
MGCHGNIKFHLILWMFINFMGIAVVTIGLNSCVSRHGMLLADFIAVALAERFFG